MKNRQWGALRYAFRCCALIGGIAGILTSTAGCAAVTGPAAQPADRPHARTDGNTVRLKDLSELSELIRKKAIATVIAIDFEGQQYVLDPAYVKAERVTFPTEAKEIRQPISVIAIPYKVNPDCVLLYQTNLVLWMRYCR